MNSGAESLQVATAMGAIVGLIIGAVIASLIAAIFLKMAIAWVAGESAEYGRCFSTTLLSYLIWGAGYFAFAILPNITDESRVPGEPLASPNPLILLLSYPVIYVIHSFLVANRLELTLGKAFLAALIQGALWFAMIIILVVSLIALTA